MALVSSVATGSVAGGGVYMMIFGLGTLPAMISVGVAKQKFPPALRSRIRKLMPVMLAVAGIILVLRGILVEFPVPGKADSITICK